jgi:HAD superfamily hydrolase (TIGR01549 family)
VYLDYTRLAEGVSAALGITLTGERLSSHAADATRAMEAGGGNDRHRAATYLETLFVLGGVPPERMSEVRACLGQMHQERHLWCSVREASASALARLRAAGVRLGVVSNSDGRVEEALQAAGLRHLFDVVVDSTLAGVEKPDPRIFQAALDQLGVKPEEALYVGDLYEVDVIGARAAGIEAVLLVGQNNQPLYDCRTITSIENLVNELLAGTSSVTSGTDPIGDR